MVPSVTTIAASSTKAPGFGFGMFGWAASDEFAKKLEEAQKDPKTAFKGWSGTRLCKSLLDTNIYFFKFMFKMFDDR